jgi:hypothetical protein
MQDCEYRYCMMWSKLADRQVAGQLFGDYALPPPPIHPSIPTLGWEGEGSSSSPCPKQYLHSTQLQAKLMYIKLPMYLFFIELILNDLRWAIGPKQHLLRSLPFQGPKKSQFPGPTPSNGPRNGYCPLQNHYVPRHISNRYTTEIVIINLMVLHKSLHLYVNYIHFG